MIFFVQGRERADRQLLDAAALVGHLVPEGSVFAFLAEHRGEVFGPELFADLFPARTGRPSLPGEVAAAVLVLQALHDLSDRDAVAAVRCDIRWKVACGLPLDHEGFHPATLTYWRRRLVASGRPDRIFEAIRAVVAGTGILEPGTGLFTGGKLTRASGEAHHEAVVGLELLAGEDRGLEVLGDTAYGTGQARGDLTAAGHIPVIKPGPLRPAVPGGFTIDDLTTDETAGTATCPNGVTRRITVTRHVVFGAACRNCPLRERCTTSADGRTLRLHEHDATLRQARRDWASRQDLRDTYRQHRPMVERSIAWLTGPQGRCRQLRYRGVTSNNQWLQLRMAALNLRRLINHGPQTAPAGHWTISGPPDPHDPPGQRPRRCYGGP